MVEEPWIFRPSRSPSLRTLPIPEKCPRDGSMISCGRLGRGRRPAWPTSSRTMNRPSLSSTVERQPVQSPYFFFFFFKGSRSTLGGFLFAIIFLQRVHLVDCAPSSPELDGDTADGQTSQGIPRKLAISPLLLG